MIRRLKDHIARRYPSEEGAALIMVMVFMIAFSIVVASILDFARTGLNASDRIAETRDTQLDFDGAVEGAINNVRRIGINNDEPDPADYDCPTFTEVEKVIVTCSLNADLETDEDQPPYAVLTLGTDEFDGIGFVTDGNKRVTVRGGLRSNGQIATGTGGLLVVGPAAATGGCDSDRIVVTVGELDCDLPDAEPSPGYVPALSDADIAAYVADINRVDPTPECVAGRTDLIRFRPGIYTEAPSAFLEADSIAACKNAEFWWFDTEDDGTLGRYYFDPVGDDGLWSVFDTASVIGGEPNGWTPSDPSSVPELDENTEAPCDRDAAGVQFLVGADVRFHIKGHDNFFALCGSAVSADNKQRIALFGLESGTRNTTNPTLKIRTGAIDENDGFTPTAGDLPAVAALTGPDTASMSLVDFGPASHGEFIDTTADDQVVLKITHTETDKDIEPTVHVAYTSRLGDEQMAQPFDLPNSNGSSRTDTLDLKDLLSTQEYFPEDFTWEAVENITVAYEVSLDGPKKKNDPAPTGAATLTEVALEVQSVAAGPNPRRGCNAAGADPLIFSDSHPNLVIEGTVYAPDDCLDIDLKQKTGSAVMVFGRGVVARHVEVTGNPSFTQTRAPFQLSTNILSRVVLFTAYADEDGDGVPDGNPRLRATVKYTDHRLAGNRREPFPGFSAEVTAWSWLR